MRTAFRSAHAHRDLPADHREIFRLTDIARPAAGPGCNYCALTASSYPAYARNVCEQRLQLGRGEGTANEKTLRFNTALALQVGPLGLGFHALGGGRHADAVRQVDDRTHDSAAVVIRRQFANE